MCSPRLWPFITTCYEQPMNWTWTVLTLWPLATTLECLSLKALHKLPLLPSSTFVLLSFRSLWRISCQSIVQFCDLNIQAFHHKSGPQVREMQTGCKCNAYCGLTQKASHISHKVMDNLYSIFKYEKKSTVLLPTYEMNWSFQTSFLHFLLFFSIMFFQ